MERWRYLFQIRKTQGTKTQAPANGGWNGLQSQTIEVGE